MDVGDVGVANTPGDVLACPPTGYGKRFVYQFLFGQGGIRQREDDAIASVLIPLLDPRLMVSHITCISVLSPVRSSRDAFLYITRGQRSPPPATWLVETNLKQNKLNSSAIRLKMLIYQNARRLAGRISRATMKNNSMLSERVRGGDRGGAQRVCSRRWTCSPRSHQ